MEKTPKRRGVTRDEWLRAALDELSYGSVSDISVQALARKLGIGKSGFYWHFGSKPDLLRALLDYWVHEITEVITANPQMQELDPESRLRKTAEMILDYGLVRYEIGIRQWALRNAEAAKVVKKVNTLRLNYAREILAELGFTGDDLEMRAMAFVCYHTWELPMFREMSKKKLRGLIQKRVEMICWK
jgi:AcrR family transcriptional regulator